MTRTQPKIGKLVFVLVAIFQTVISAHLWATQVTFEATVDRTELSEDETLTYTLIVAGEGNINTSEPKLPTLGGFELVNNFTQSQMSSVYQNGKFQLNRKMIYKYILRPLKPGQFTIESSEIEVENNKLTTRPVTVTVKPAGQGRRQQAAPPPNDDEDPTQMMPGIDDEDDVFSQLLKRRGLLRDRNGGIRSQPFNEKEAFFVIAEVDKSRAYVGEQINAKWYIATKGGISGFDALKYPELKGFWKEDIEMATRLNFQPVTINGQNYNQALLVHYALFPIAPGKKIIDSYKAKATIIDMSGSMGVFGMGRPFTATKVSKELPVEVIPLPEKGKPDSFSGAVGQFSVTGSLSSAQAKVNQPVSLKIRFQGAGNVKAIELPPLQLPANIELYDTKKEAQFLKTGQSFKEFELLLIPRAQGQVKVPPIEMSYFDPKTAKYVVQKTPEFNLQVMPADPNQQGPGAQVPLVLGETNSKSFKEDIRYLKNKAYWNLGDSITKGILGGAFTLIWAFGFITIYRQRKGEDSSLEKLKKKVALKLKSAKLKLKSGDARGVGVECNNAVLSTLGEVSGLGGASLTLEDMLVRSKLDQGTKDRVSKFLSKCEVLSFAPDHLSGEVKSNLGGFLTEAQNLISQILVEAERAESVAPTTSSGKDLPTS